MKTKTSCYTYFRMAGYFDPDVISERLGLRPTDICRIGDLREDGEPHEIAQWEYGMCEEYDVDVRNQMRKTISGLLDKVDELNQIRNDFDAVFFLEVVPYIYFKDKDTTPILSPPMDVIDFCHETRTEIDIDYYLFSR